MFLDFKKAFDLVNHKVLLDKTGLYGGTADTVNWFKSYLSDRRQCVKVNGLKSLMPVKQGVLRDQLSGRYHLFSSSTICHCMSQIPADVDIYADDSTPTISSRWNANISFMEKNINEDLDQVVKWSKMNKMVICQTKTKCMFVVGKRLRKRLDNINSNGATIDQVKSHKLLGNHLDQDLDFDNQTEVICKSYHRKLAFSST